MTTSPRGLGGRFKLTLLKRAKLASIFAYPFLAVISVPSMMSLEGLFLNNTVIDKANNLFQSLKSMFFEKKYTI